LLDSATIADQIKKEVVQEVAQFAAAYGVNPCLAAVRVGDDPASAVYVRNKIRACEEVGIRSEHHALPATTKARELAELIASLNCRDDVDGILVQLPLPGEIDEAQIIEAIDPAKDVDGFHPISVGRLAMGRPGFVPCTPAGIIELLERSAIPIAGASACIVGRKETRRLQFAIPGPATCRRSPDKLISWSWLSAAQGLLGAITLRRAPL
jgi:methylenetetrahydrofolate dehydrogenase (NADP+)/methenyltetrahydrofolate cyclohydrolase